MNYRIVVKANVGFTIAANSEEEAIVLANTFRAEMTEIHTVENMINRRGRALRRLGYGIQCCRILGP